MVETPPGLDTLGVSLARIDYASLGPNPPHTHPRGTKILFVTRETLYADGNRFFAKTLREGSAIVVPLETQLNIRDTSAVAFVGFGSQNPAVVTIATAVLGSDRPIKPEFPRWSVLVWTRFWVRICGGNSEAPTDD